MANNPGNMQYRPPHICTVVGARPQLIKAAPLSRALQAAGAAETLVHTGQHYDHGLSQIFFDQLALKGPTINLGVGSGPHAWQTATIMTRLERYLLDTPAFDLVLVYGDTNSTLAAALVTAKLQLPLAHVEAGLRSFNRTMPEEVNRVVTDHLSHWLFCPTRTATENLAREGISQGVYQSGDVMLDATRLFSAQAAQDMPLDRITSLTSGAYALATVHRAANTDDRARLAGIFAGLKALKLPILLPMHPRTRARLGNVRIPANVTVLAPVGYLAMLTLIRHAQRVITDSGGLQKEAYWLGIPCVTLREETEWVETTHNGWNRCSDVSPDAIVQAASASPTGPQRPLGEGPGESASTAIATQLVRGTSENP